MACNCHMCGTLLMARPEVRQYFPINSIFKNGFSVPKRLDQISKGSGILLFVRDKIIVLPLNRYSLPLHIEILFFELNLKEPKMACMLFLQFPQKLNQRLFTSTYRRYSVLLNANRRKKNLCEKRNSRQTS